jgi:hypothetical protein
MGCAAGMCSCRGRAGTPTRRPTCSPRSSGRRGVITVDVEAELAKLDPAGWRPLRPAAPDLSLL